MVKAAKVSSFPSRQWSFHARFHPYTPTNITLPWVLGQDTKPEAGPSSIPTDSSMQKDAHDQNHKAATSNRNTNLGEGTPDVEMSVEMDIQQVQHINEATRSTAGTGETTREVTPIAIDHTGGTTREATPTDQPSPYAQSPSPPGSIIARVSPAAPAGAPTSRLTARISPAASSRASISRITARISSAASSRSSTSRVTARISPAASSRPSTSRVTARVSPPAPLRASNSRGPQAEQRGNFQADSPYTNARAKQFSGQGRAHSYHWYRVKSQIDMEYPPLVPIGISIPSGAVFIHVNIITQRLRSWVRGTSLGEERWLPLGVGDKHVFEHGVYVYSYNRFAPSWATEESIRKKKYVKRKAQ